MTSPGAATSRFSVPPAQLMRQRVSHRTFRKEPIPPGSLERLRRAMDASLAAPFGSTVRFGLIAATEDDSHALRGLGTYGFIKNPAAFLAGVLGAGAHGLEDFGYRMEALVLAATDLGLGSCWLGGTFRRSRFGARMALLPDESIPAVVALGMPVAKPRATERLVRWAIKAHERRPWEDLFFGSVAQERLAPVDAWWAEALEMVRIAPSASNRQPWQVVKEESRFHFFLRRSPGYRENGERLGWSDLQRIDMGIAMCHFELAAAQAGVHGQWVHLPPQEPLPSTSYTATWTAG